MTLPYRPNVCMLVIDTHGRILLNQERGEERVMWKFPQGGVEKGETDEEAIRRELEEEVRITHYSILAKAHYIHRYDWSEAMQKRKGYRGQEQHVYLIRSHRPTEARPGEEKIIQTQWIPFEEALQLFTNPKQIKASKTIWKEFGPIAKKGGTPLKK